MPSAIPSRRLYLGAAGVSALVVVMAALLLISQLATATIASGGAFVAGAPSTDLVAGKIDAQYDLEFSSTSTTSSLAVIVTFPAGYAIAATSTVQDDSSTPGAITIDGASVPVTVTTDQASSTIRIAFAGTTTTNETIKFRVLTGVTNPLNIGPTGLFGIAYEGNAGNITDEKTDVLSVIIVAQSSMYVDDTLGSDTNDCLSPGGGACKTIQFAIDRLVSTTTVSSTINVAARTYTEENVVIDKALRLQGAGTSTKIAPADGDGVETNASNVTVDGFSIEPLHSGADGFGI